MTEDNQTSDYVENQPSTAPISAEKVEVNTELSKVASNPKRNILIMSIFGVVFIYIIYQIIASQQTKTPPPPPPLVAPTNVFKPGTTVDTNSSTIPAVPELPKIIRPVTMEDEPAKADAPAAPPPPPPLPLSSAPPLPPAPSLSSSTSLPNLVAPPSEDIINDSKRLEAKRKSSVFLINGKPETLTPEEVKIRTDFTYRGNLTYLLGRGKVIDAVLESAINSDFPGEILALVSRDVYSESGKVILIPKGSRIIGNFAASAEGGYGRINIAWSRIDLPSGYSLTLSSQVVDNLGRTGVQGRVDNKHKEQFANAILSSAFKIALAAGLDKVVPPPVTTNTAATQTATATALTAAISQTQTQITTTPASYTTPLSQINAYCAAAQAAITDKASATYNTVTTACTTAQTNAGTGGDAALQTLLVALNGAATGLNNTASTASTPTQAQLASQEAYKDIGSKVGEMLTKDDIFTPTITLDQGEHIKIYVNKDYLFPKSAISNTRVMQ